MDMSILNVLCSSSSIGRAGKCTRGLACRSIMRTSELRHAGSALVALDLLANALTGTLPELVSGPAAGLQYLYLSHNSLIGEQVRHKHSNTVVEETSPS